MKQNPWGITDREGQSLSAVVELGSTKAAARAMGITEGAIGELVSRAHRRMTDAGAVPFGSRITHYVVWDRWVREQAKQ